MGICFVVYMYDIFENKEELILSIKFFIKMEEIDFLLKQDKNLNKIQFLYRFVIMTFF